jgi:hypothetical protein
LRDELVAAVPITSMNVRSHPLMNFKTEALAHQAEHRGLFRFEPGR